jgi:uncharacterized protein YndB with AHSA1/START domain
LKLQVIGNAGIVFSNSLYMTVRYLVATIESKFNITMKKLIVNKNIDIHAPASKVWEVLVAPKFIRQWDALPEGFPDYYLEVGREVEWSGSSRLIVTEISANELLKQSLFLSKWGVTPSEIDISISYKLIQMDNSTKLSMEIGDFAQLKEAQGMYDHYTEFAGKVLGKIKALSENKV